MAAKRSTAVPEVSGVHWATSKYVAEAVLSRRPRVVEVEANPVAQTATVTYDPTRTSVAELAGWVRDCGYHCAGQSDPEHICDPLAESAAATDKHDHPQTTDHAQPVPDADHAGHAHAPITPQDATGHGAHHAGIAMDDMVRDMRNRFHCRRTALHPDLAVVPDMSGGDRLQRRSTVRAARRCLPEPAGDLLLGLDLLRRRLAGAPSAHLGHDGSGRRSHRRRLA
jgi:copper chaperone CopZ